eukprot:scaffold10943_cov102-Isochrysis_galbana.AAC.7
MEGGGETGRVGANAVGMWRWGEEKDRLDAHRPPPHVRASVADPVPNLETVLPPPTCPHGPPLAARKGLLKGGVHPAHPCQSPIDRQARHPNICGPSLPPRANPRHPISSRLCPARHSPIPLPTAPPRAHQPCASPSIRRVEPRVHRCGRLAAVLGGHREEGAERAGQRHAHWLVVPGHQQRLLEVAEGGGGDASNDEQVRPLHRPSERASEGVAGGDGFDELGRLHGEDDE